MAETQVQMEEEEALELSILSAFEGWPTDKLCYFGPISRSLLLNGEIEENAAAGIISQILLLDELNNEPITVHINTPGGSLRDALAIYDVLRSIESPIVTVVTGCCYSAGLIISAAGDKRYAYPHSMFFYHQPLVESVGFVSPEETKEFAIFYEEARSTLDELLRLRAKISKTKWKKEFEGRISKHLTAEDAKALNLIDDIIIINEKIKKQKKS